jgi:putative FmdB family regulatory protein
MPIYEYQCDDCGRIYEVMQKISEKPLAKCSHCSGKMHKLISHSAFHLKGTGWYVTDYAGKSQSHDSTSNASPKDAKSGESNPPEKSKAD